MQPRLGDRITKLVRWKGGALGVAEYRGAAAPFQAFGAGAGARLPQLPKDTKVVDLLVHDDGSIIAYSTFPLVTVLGWTPRSARAVVLPLRAYLGQSEGWELDSVTLDAGPEGPEVEVRADGEMPIEKPAVDVLRTDSVRAMLLFKNGRWKVDDQRFEEHLLHPPDTEALEADKRFTIILKLVSPNVRWIVGELEEHGSRRSYLLRNLPVDALWQTSPEPVHHPHPKLIPNCK